MAIETDSGQPETGTPKKTTKPRAARKTAAPKKTKAKADDAATESPVVAQRSARKVPGTTPAITLKKPTRSSTAAASTTKRRPTRKKTAAAESTSPAVTETAHSAPVIAESGPPIVAKMPAVPPPDSKVALPTELAVERATSDGGATQAPAERPRRERGRRGGRRTRGRRGRREDGQEPQAGAAVPTQREVGRNSAMPDAATESPIVGEPQEEERDSGGNGLYPPRTGTSATLAESDDVRGGRRGRRGRRGRGRNGREGREGGRGLAELAGPSAEFMDDDEVPMEVMPDEDLGDDGGPPSTAVRDMIINVSAGDECRIAVMHEGRLEELFIERTATQSHVGNIYKGRITNVEPSIQAAFIDFGLPKNGFLHISDVQPQYFPNHHGESEDVGRKIPRHHRPLIQKCFRRGQEVIVQITKEGVGTKGPTLTTYLSIPGRFLVMMPGMSQVGVSRKIEDDTTRRKMRDMLAELDLPPGMGFILRTAGLDRTKRELQRDLHYLLRLWKTVVDRVRNLPTPTELYRESDLVIRTIRDIYSPEFRRLVVDDPATAERAREFLQVAMPRSKSVVELYADREPLFHRFGIEQEIERINMRHVPLRSGGSLVIDTTEAMVTIDVNSGKFRTLDDAEESAYRINIEAAEEIARQLRLRDLGGLLVCDFIDMRQDRHKRGVEKALRDALKKHKERARILRMSAFGIIEMTRQRQGPSLKKNIYYDCPHCRGAGVVKMPESVILDVMRLVQLAAHHEQVRKITVSVSTDVAFRILNKKRAILAQIEAETGKAVMIRGEDSFTSDQVECVCEDAREQPVALPSLPQPSARG